MYVYIYMYIYIYTVKDFVKTSICRWKMCFKFPTIHAHFTIFLIYKNEAIKQFFD